MHHPDLQLELTRQRAEDLRAQVSRGRAGIQQPTRLRRQAGWLLIDLGARMALGRFADPCAASGIGPAGR